MLNALVLIFDGIHLRIFLVSFICFLNLICTSVAYAIGPNVN
jgi:hypothetical protein